MSNARELRIDTLEGNHWQASEFSGSIKSLRFKEEPTATVDQPSLGGWIASGVNRFNGLELRD